MAYATAIRVVQFIIHETGTYNDQYRRPYISNLTPYGLTQVLEKAAQAPRINAGIFSGLSSQIVAPSATPESNILIPHGWNERRMRFMLQLEIDYRTGGTIHEIITGWTETPANSISIYGKLDPQTVFRINNTIHIRQQNVNTPLGVQTRSSITDCSHVLADNNWTGINTPQRNISMRPTDIFSKIIVSGVENELSMEGSYDATTTLSNIATKSKRTNGISTNYIADILGNYVQADAQMGIGKDPIGNTDALSIAQSYSAEMSAARDPFLDAIASFSSLPVSDSFTLDDLNRLDPSSNDRTVYVKLGAVESSQVHHAGQTQGWGGTDLHTHIANILSNSVPSIMMNHLITAISFVSTNMDISGRTDTRIADIKGFVPNMDLSSSAQAFIGKLENEILGDLVTEYQAGFAIQMQVDLLGESWIKLNINGEEIDFVTPSFCDAMFVPVVTSNNQVASSLAEGFHDLMTNVSDFKTNQGMSGFTTGQGIGFKSIL